MAPACLTRAFWATTALVLLAGAGTSEAALDALKGLEGLAKALEAAAKDAALPPAGTQTLAPAPATKAPRTAALAPRAKPAPAKPQVPAAASVAGGPLPFGSMGGANAPPELPSYSSSCEDCKICAECGACQTAKLVCSKLKAPTPGCLRCRKDCQQCPDEPPASLSAYAACAGCEQCVECCDKAFNDRWGYGRCGTCGTCAMCRFCIF